MQFAVMVQAMHLVSIFLMRMTSNSVGGSADAEVPCKVFVQIQVF